MTLATLVIFSISTFSSVGNGGGFGITTIQARKKTRQLSNLLDQQAVILVSLDINPNWARRQSAADSLIYGIMEPDDTVPTGVDEDHSYLVISNHNKKISLFSKVDKEKVTIKYANHGEKLYIKTIPLSRLAEQSYRTKKQRRQMNKYASALRTEWLIGHRKLGLWVSETSHSLTIPYSNCCMVMRSNYARESLIDLKIS